MGILDELIRGCITLGWFYADEDVMIIWAYLPENEEEIMTVEDFLEKIHRHEFDTVCFLKCWGKPKPSVFKKLRQRFFNEKIRVVKWVNLKGKLKEVKLWETLVVS